MTPLPGIEARIGAQERLTTMVHARIEELSQDMGASFNQLAKYQIATERTLEARFNQVDARFDKIEAHIATMATKEDFAALKEDIASLEARMLDAFKQLVTLIDKRLPTEPQQ